MQTELNPFVPGSGLTPPHLVGREREVDAFDLIVARSRGGRASRSIVLHGLRGVGKTVLLNRFRAQAERAEWMIVEFEANETGAGLEAARRRLARGMALAARRLYRGRAVTDAVRRALESITAFSVAVGGVSVGVDIAPAVGRADTGRIDVDLEEMLEDMIPALREQGIAFAIFIDEMQDLDAELLTALLAVQHRAGQREWPIYIVGAGLPSLPAVLSRARSYAERLFDYREVGALDARSASEALVVPVRRTGADFDADALELLVGAARGYPYFLQTYGQAAWELAIGRIITSEDATEAIERGNSSLDMGFFPARWDRTTRAEREYLSAVAVDGESISSTNEVASRLGVAPNRMSTVRQSLIEKGVLYSPERGYVSFTVPAMDEFVRRRAEASD
jgi:hypothetical protein